MGGQRGDGVRRLTSGSSQLALPLKGGASFRGSGQVTKSELFCKRRGLMPIMFDIGLCFGFSFFYIRCNLGYGLTSGFMWVSARLLWSTSVVNFCSHQYNVCSRSQMQN